MSPYDLAYEYALHTQRSIFLTGKAGTGKTTFLRQLRQSCPKQVAVAAPTGVAAINAEGVTIHSLFQLPPQVFIPTDEARRLLFKEIQMREQKRKVLKSLELLVIDEVSMVRADLLDTIDAVLRHYKHRPYLPFGGTQVLLIGDLYQLSPVARREDWERMREWYDGPYFFQARVFRELTPVYIELDHVFRQTNMQFVDLLNHVRNNTLSREGLRVLNSRYREHVTLGDAILLSTHNRKVDAINEREMERLSTKAYTYKAVVQKNFPESMYPMDEELVLKVGAKVMFIKNDSSPDKRYYNGKLGVVTSLSKNNIEVTCPKTDTDLNATPHPGEAEQRVEVIQVGRETWENLRYITEGDSGEIETEIAGTFNHYPLRLAWAVTIHKAQGLTFDKVIIDAEDAFAAGQVYVALSRCRSLEGITLTSRIPEHALTNAREVVQFTAHQPELQAVEQALTSSENDYLMMLLCSLYDFRVILQQLYRWRSQNVHLNSLQGDAVAFLQSCCTLIEDAQTVAEKFQNQIRAILLSTTQNTSAGSPKEKAAYLIERLQKAKGYFSPILEKVLDGLEHCPIRSNDKDEATDFQQHLEENHADISRILYMMGHIVKKVSIKDWYSAKNTFKPQATGIHIYTIEKKKRQSRKRKPSLQELLKSMLPDTDNDNL